MSTKTFNWDGDGVKAEADGFNIVAHGNTANYLFMDGHVENHNTEVISELIDDGAWTKIVRE